MKREIKKIINSLAFEVAKLDNVEEINDIIADIIADILEKTTIYFNQNRTDGQLIIQQNELIDKLSRLSFSHNYKLKLKKIVPEKHIQSIGFVQHS